MSVTAGDNTILSLWDGGATLETIANELGKTPTSIAHKLVRLGVFETRSAANADNENRGGRSVANLEHDALYTIYLIRNPSTNAPVYVGQTQNFAKRRKNHVRRFSKLLGVDEPIIEELETVRTYAEAREAEKKRIAKFWNQGFRLLNVQDRELCNRRCITFRSTGPV